MCLASETIFVFGGIAGRVPLRGLSTGAALLCNGFHACGDFCRIAEEIVAHAIQPFVELEHIRSSRWQIERRDFVVRYAFQVFDNAA